MKPYWGARIRTAAVLLAGILSANALAARVQDAEPFKFFREYVGLKDEQINSIRSGKAFAKILDSPTPDEVYVFGSVYVNSTPERYLKFASDIDVLRKVPNYLAIQKFSNSPKLSDLEGFTLEEQDIKELKKCGPGHCEVQLPSEAMDTFKQSINWSAPDVADQVTGLSMVCGTTEIRESVAALIQDPFAPAFAGDSFCTNHVVTFFRRLHDTCHYHLALLDENRQGSATQRPFIST
jgi:hypothetical protein